MNDTSDIGSVEKLGGDIPFPFTQILPSEEPDRHEPNWVALRFDGAGDTRSDLSLAALRVISKWPGNWAWCRDMELYWLVMSRASPKARGDNVKELESENAALRKSTVGIRNSLITIESLTRKTLDEYLDVEIDGHAKR